MQPYKCPVCNGRGFVPNGFYSATTQEYVSVNISPETCRSCGGTGIIWDNAELNKESGAKEYNYYIYEK